MALTRSNSAVLQHPIEVGAQALRVTAVTVLVPGFLMPRMVMHMCSAWIRTITPLGFSSSIKASAIWAVSRSCSWNRLANTSTVRAILLRPTTSPSGI